jgi:hypothetical protein
LEVGSSSSETFRTIRAGRIAIGIRTALALIEDAVERLRAFTVCRIERVAALPVKAGELTIAGLYPGLLLLSSFVRGGISKNVKTSPWGRSSRSLDARECAVKFEALGLNDFCRFRYR